MKSNDLKEYKRHIRKQKKYITSENFKELGELKTYVTKELVALECHSDRIDIDIDESDYDNIEILALSVLKAIRNISPTIDLTLIQKRIGYGFGKSKYLITWLSEKCYIQKIVNEDEEDLGYGIRGINYTVEEISEILESKKQ